jgi:hypothetical protein
MVGPRAGWAFLRREKPVACAGIRNPGSSTSKIQNIQYQKIINVVQAVFKWGHTLGQLVEALRYKPEGCGFDSRWCQWNF